MERRSITVQGLVQGVGFRPFVHALASRLELAGFVANQTGGVYIEVEGDTATLNRFLRLLESQRPPLAQVDELAWECRPTQGEDRFHIVPSMHVDESAAVICPDASTCDDCLQELFDPTNRRYRYPFINCINCGPRLTIVTSVPYDRQRTTMSEFRMCLACRAEYEDPTSRRFHAQAIACPACGPHIWVVDRAGNDIETDDPLSCFARALREGKIGALKGLGGYHLVCDARSASAVAELRSRKGRDEKPFAIMVRDLESAKMLCELDVNEERQLQDWRRPIVLLRKQSGISLVDPIAPRNASLGLMLPYTPLHSLLFDVVGNIPLVMTSANRSDEPIAYQNKCAQRRLSEIADIFIHHDRTIHMRCDDSVIRVVAGRALPVRRSRGYVPQPIRLPLKCSEPLLAVGGQIKVTFAIGRGSEAILSHHIGDLDNYEAYRQFENDVEMYRRLLEVRPKWIVHDLHPDYASTRFALRVQTEEGGERIGVQHHHAHLASCLVENNSVGPAIGVIFDGSGFGVDGAIWGGEFLVGDLTTFRRGAHLRYVLLPGGEQAIREPWRMAASYLMDAGLDLRCLDRRTSPEALRVVERMLERRINAPSTSSAGRLFDTVASLAGVRDCVSYEGQAAIELEGLASGVRADGAYSFNLGEAPEDATIIADTRPLICDVMQDVRRGVDSAIIARRFHSTMVELISAVCAKLRQRTGLTTVAMSGGVFLNALLTAEVTARLTSDGFHVLRHCAVPPNDGGLSLGQLAVGAARLAAKATTGAADVSRDSR